MENSSLRCEQKGLRTSLLRLQRTVLSVTVKSSLDQAVGNMELDVHGNYHCLLGTGRLGGREFFISNTYPLHCHDQNDCIKACSCVNHFTISLLVQAKSQDSVRKL